MRALERSNRSLESRTVKRWVEELGEIAFQSITRRARRRGQIFPTDNGSDCNQSIPQCFIADGLTRIVRIPSCSWHSVRADQPRIVLSVRIRRFNGLFSCHSVDMNRSEKAICAFYRADIKRSEYGARCDFPNAVDTVWRSLREYE